MAGGWELWPVGETRRWSGRPVRGEGGVWCEWPGAGSCGRSERQGRGAGGLAVKRGGCGRALTAVDGSTDKEEVREAWP